MADTLPAAEAEEERWVQRGPRIPLPEPSQALGQFLWQRLLARADKTALALVDGASGEEVSAAQLLARAVTVAEELRARGVRPGDVVCTALDNRLEVAYVVLGTLFTGAVYAPYNPDLHADDVRSLLEMLSPRVVLCAPRAAAAARAALPPSTAVVEVAPGDAQWEAFAAPADEAAATAASAVADFKPQGDMDLKGAAVILCSSGTTGPPKGVVLSHSTWILMLQCIDVLLGFVPAEVRARDKGLQVTPNFWLTGFLALVQSFSTGTPLVLLPQAPFDAEALLGTVQRHRVSTFMLTPPQVAGLAKHPRTEDFDVSSVRHLGYGGAPLSSALRARAAARLRLARPLTHYFAQTECPMVALPGPLSPNKPDSVGRAAPNTCIKIVDFESGRVLGPNAEGEICVRSPMAFSEYYKAPEATRQSLDAHGWVHTGDVGFLDEEGYLFVTDRFKELVKYKGVHIAPAEVEGVLEAHEGVRDAAVVGIEHDEDQEHPVGFVVRQEGHGVTAQELLQAVKEQLPVYKQLHGGVYFVDTIPRTATGKIKRRELRQEARKLQQMPHLASKH